MTNVNHFCHIRFGLSATRCTDAPSNRARRKKASTFPCRAAARGRPLFPRHVPTSLLTKLPPPPVEAEDWRDRLRTATRTLGVTRALPNPELAYLERLRRDADLTNSDHRKYEILKLQEVDRRRAEERRRRRWWERYSSDSDVVGLSDALEEYQKLVSLDGTTSLSDELVMTRECAL